MKTGLISVITPAYQCRGSIRRAAESMLAQTYAQWEWIVTDDGSTDGTGSELDALAASDARIHVIHQQNAGVSAARNAALRQVSGEYLMFLDADDELRADAMEKLMQAMKGSDSGTPPDLLIYAWTFIREADGSREPYVFSPQEEEARGEVLYETLLKEQYGCGGGYPWNKIWRVSALSQDARGALQGFREDISLYEDKFWVLENLDGNPQMQVSFLNEPLYLYYISGDSLSHQNTPESEFRHEKDLIRPTQMIWNYVKRHHPSAGRAAMNWHRDHILHYLWFGKENLLYDKSNAVLYQHLLSLPQEGLDPCWRDRQDWLKPYAMGGRAWIAMKNMQRKMGLSEHDG